MITFCDHRFCCYILDIEIVFNNLMYELVGDMVLAVKRVKAIIIFPVLKLIQIIICSLMTYFILSNTHCCRYSMMQCLVRTACIKMNVEARPLIFKDSFCSLESLVGPCTSLSVQMDCTCQKRFLFYLPLQHQQESHSMTL